MWYYGGQSTLSAINSNNISGIIEVKVHMCN